MAAPADLSGTWKFGSQSANFEEFLTAMDIGFITRKAILSIEPDIIIKQNGDSFEITTETPVTSDVVKFKVGEEFIDDQNPLKDEPTKAIVNWKGNVLVQKSVDNDKDPVISRFIEDGKLVFSQKLGDIEARHVFYKSDLCGTWKFESESDNFEEFLKAINVGFITRKAIVNIKPEIIIKQDGDDFVITMKTPVSSNVLKFKVGEEFIDDDNPLKDEPTKTIVNWEEDVLVQKSVDNDKDPVISRFIEDGKFIFTYKLGDIEARQVFHV